MAWSVDSRNAGTKTTGASSISWTHTVGTLTNGFLAVQAGTGSAGGTTVSGVLWDSGGANTALSNTVNAVAASKQASSNNVWAYLWYLKAPASGAKTIKITASASCEITGGSASYDGVAQVTTFNASSPNSSAPGGGNPTVTVTSSANELVISAASIDEGGALGTMTAGQTQISNNDNGAGSSWGGMEDANAAGASTVMAWTCGNSANSNSFATVGFSVIPSAGGGATDTQEWMTPTPRKRGLDNRAITY